MVVVMIEMIWGVDVVEMCGFVCCVLLWSMNW